MFMNKIFVRVYDFFFLIEYNINGWDKQYFVAQC